MANLETSEANAPAKHGFFRTLYFQVLVGIAVGVALGALYPSLGEQMKPLGDAFVKLIKMLIAPIIFLTVVTGIAGIGDMKKLGRVGLKALLYFEVVTTIALVIGLIVVELVKPGAGINATPESLNAGATAQYVQQAQELSLVDHLLKIIPDTIVGAFTGGEILQVLFIAILFGVALVAFGEKGKQLVRVFDSLAHVFFGVISIIMRFAPIGAFGAMAFTIGKYGIKTLLPLGKLMLCVYLTAAFFVFVVLGAIAYFHKFSIFKFLRYIKEEIFIVLGTSSSESALPRMMVKLEELGCSKSVVGLVIPSGYSFNLDGTAIYLTIAAIFVAQATNTDLTLWDELKILLILMLTSKGAAGVTGSGFITLAATLSSVGTIPVAGIALLLGVDRFMSEMRSITNLIGNGVATVVVSKWEGEFNAARAEKVLNQEIDIEDTDPLLSETKLKETLHERPSDKF
ncbi:MAG TPA: dicarboxylate/amino acid:cation symporter [Pyrinomonadaceae bacterium]|jgi:aerobic C4-dicarboxylate transport protein|nr:dicarboxylate/amino acid:cation symporter [Pyrinomonadaceae bacterium]